MLFAHILQIIVHFMLRYTLVTQRMFRRGIFPAAVSSASSVTFGTEVTYEKVIYEGCIPSQMNVRTFSIDFLSLVVLVTLQKCHANEQ